MDFSDLDLACSRDVRICPDLIQGKNHYWESIFKWIKKLENSYSQSVNGFEKDFSASLIKPNNRDYSFFSSQLN
ncbi:unnamed protein product [Oikopleura dioica]|uniref:Uncharacterized protein n=1 Tax=Oikopleura dioica TaxID=34765 RepID=E4YE37_OIKDI|nr:unnamed protein product [Oikopleura dioica]